MVVDMVVVVLSHDRHPLLYSNLVTSIVMFVPGNCLQQQPRTARQTVPRFQPKIGMAELDLSLLSRGLLCNVSQASYLYRSGKEEPDNRWLGQLFRI